MKRKDAVKLFDQIAVNLKHLGCICDSIEDAHFDIGIEYLGIEHSSYDTPCYKEFVKLFKPRNKRLHKLWFGEIWDLYIDSFIKENLETRFNALTLFRQICLDQKLYKEW